VENHFQVHIRYTEQSVIIDMGGDLSKQAEQELLKLNLWEEGLADGRKYLILNFTQVPYINSLGIAVLIRIVRAGVKGGYQSFAFGVTPHYQKLFRMVGLTEYMMLYPDEYAIEQRIEMLSK
jgi:anti-anti-sigma factor